MIYYLIPAIVIIVSLAIIIFIVIKKIPDLALINVESISQEKESKVRNRIILERLARKFLELKKVLIEWLKPLIKNLSASWENLYHQAVALEQETLKEAQPLKQIDIKQEIRDKLKELEKLITEKNFSSAEELSISILKLDANNPDAYEALAKIYLEQKEYKKARETGRYLIKLFTKLKPAPEEIKHRLANCYADLGLVYQLENKNNSALTNFQKAVGLEPSNPRFLDLLLKISIIVRNKNLAWQVFNSLKKADPSNQKLKELKADIENLPS